jgi:hypothetical protein
MPAELIPFPLTRRRVFIRRNAERIASAARNTAEKLLAHAIQQQVDVMTRRGIEPSAIAREIRWFEQAIRAEVWRLMFFSPQRGGTA